MPNWQPNWNNVRWDWGAASEASHALRRAADRLEQTLVEKERLANVARREWRGRYRDEFDAEFAAMKTRAQQLASDFRQKAFEIDRASARAEAEQRHREAERARWQREKEAEDRARRNRD